MKLLLPSGGGFLLRVLCLTLLVGAGGQVCWGQVGGTVHFSTGSGVVRIEDTGLAAVRADGLVAGLYWAPDGEGDESRFGLVGPAVVVGAAGAAEVPGLIFAGIRTIPVEAGGWVHLQVRVWEARVGATYEEGVLVAGALTGKSGIVRVRTGNPFGVPPGVPANLSGLIDRIGVLPYECPVAHSRRVLVQRGEPVGIELGVVGTPPGVPSFEVIGGPYWGVLSGEPPDLVYTPPAGFCGFDRFYFRFEDTSLCRSMGTIDIEVVGEEPCAGGMLSVVFSNEGRGPVVNGLTGLPVSESDGVVVAFYWAETLGGVAERVGAPVPVGDGGWFSGGGRFPPSESGYVEVRAWEAALGSTYEAALANHELSDVERSLFGVSPREAIALNPLDPFPRLLDRSIRDPLTLLSPNRCPVVVALALVVRPGETGPVPLELLDRDGDALIYESRRAPSYGVLSGVPPDLDYAAAPGVCGRDRFEALIGDGLCSTTVVFKVTLECVDRGTGSSAVMFYNPGVPVFHVPAARVVGGDDRLVAGLFWAPEGVTDEGQFVQSGEALTVGDGGLFEGGVWRLPTETAGARVNLQVRVWDWSAGRTYAEAVLNSLLPSGRSGVFSAQTVGWEPGMDDGVPNLTELGLQPFDVRLRTPPPNRCPTAVAQVIRVRSGEVLEWALEVNDPDNQPLFYAFESLPRYGVLEGMAPDLRYHAVAGLCGQDRFQFRVGDGQCSASAVVTIEIECSDRGTGGSAVVFHNPGVPVNHFHAGRTVVAGDGLVAGLFWAPEGVTDEEQFVQSGEAVMVGDGGIFDGGIWRLPTVAGAARVNLQVRVWDWRAGGTYGVGATVPGRLSGKSEVVSALAVDPDGASGEAPSDLAQLGLSSFSVRYPNSCAGAASTELFAEAGSDRLVLLPGFDFDQDPLFYAVEALPAHGTLTGTPPELVYRAEPGFVGHDKIIYSVTDGTGACSPALGTVSVLVHNCPSPPGPGSVNFSNLGGVGVTNGLTGELVKPTDGIVVALFWDACQAEEDRFVQIGPSASFLSSRPGYFFAGTRTVPTHQYVNLQIRVWETRFGASYEEVLNNTEPQDGRLGWAAASGVFTVLPGNANGVPPSPSANLGSGFIGVHGVSTIHYCPTAMDLTVSTSEEEAVLITLEDHSSGGGSLIYELVSQPLYGAVSGALPNLVYTPSPDFCGEDRFSYRVSDGVCFGDAAEVTVEVGCVEDCPVAGVRVIPPVFEDLAGRYWVIAGGGGVAQVLFDGSPSFDGDGDGLSYSWVALSGTGLDEAGKGKEKKKKSKRKSRGEGPGAPGEVGCGCEGRLTELTLRYEGAAAVRVEVESWKGKPVYAGVVEPGGSFVLVGGKKKELEKGILLIVDGEPVGMMDTSCGEPIGPGTRVGDLVVTGGFSEKGGALCPVVGVGIEFGDGVVAERELEPGVHLISLTVADGGCSGSVTEEVVVITAGWAVADLRDRVEEAGLGRKLKRSLGGMLGKGEKAFEKGDIEGGEKLLRIFARKVAMVGELEGGVREEWDGWVEWILESAGMGL